MPVNDTTKKKIWLTIAGIIVFIAVVIALFVHRLYQPTTLSIDEIRANGAFLFEQPRSLQPFELVDANNQPFTEDNLPGQWTLMFFGFTYCPDICPTTMALLNNFYQQQQERGNADDMQVVMVTVDPARDTPEQLKPYVEYFNPDFVGVTGDFIDIHRLATQLSIPFSKVPGGGDDYLVEHSGNVVLINSQGHYVGFFRPPFDLAQMALTYPAIRQLRSR